MLVDGSGGILGASARIAGAKLAAGRAKTDRRIDARLWLALAGVGVVAGAAITGILKFEFPQPASVPALIGKPVSQAIPDLHHAKLDLGSELLIKSSGPVGVVVAQYPSAGTQMNAYAQVTIVVSQHGQ